MITENLSTLTINKLNQQQYNREFEAGNIDENALYLVPDKDTELIDLENKINHLQTYITPQMFGARGDGITDDTAAIQAAFDSLNDGDIIYFPSGTYIVNHGGQNYTTAIKLQNKNNITIKLNNAAIIKHSLTNSGYYRILTCSKCNNIEIYGGTISGESDIHINKVFSSSNNLTEISSYCIVLEGCQNIYLHNN